MVLVVLVVLVVVLVLLVVLGVVVVDVEVVEEVVISVQAPVERTLRKPYAQSQRYPPIVLRHISVKPEQL